MLRGEATGLRAIERTDLPQLLQWRNAPENRRYFREYRELGLDHQTLWFETEVLGSHRTRMFTIVELDEAGSERRLLGACGLCYINWVDRSADFSIYIGADDLYIDDRLAPDAGSVLLDYGFRELNLHRVWSEIYDFDSKKQKLFDRLGFTLDARHRHTHWTEGKWCDSLFFRLLSHERP